MAGKQACLERVENPGREQLGELLEEYRRALVARAERKLGTMIQRRMGASDVVQQTFLEAFRSYENFRGGSSAELVAWLTRILDNNIENVVRDHTRAGKLAISREQRLESLTDRDSQIGLGTEPAADEPSPSMHAIQHEREAYVGSLLESLPADQRLAVQLRYEGHSLAEISTEMGRSISAVASLIKRGLQSLRKHVPRQEP